MITSCEPAGGLVVPGSHDRRQAAQENKRLIINAGGFMAVRSTKINYIRGVSGSGAEGSQVLWAINGGEDSFVDPYVMAAEQ